MPGSLPESTSLLEGDARAVIASDFCCVDGLDAGQQMNTMQKVTESNGVIMSLHGDDGLAKIAPIWAQALLDHSDAYKRVSAEEIEHCKTLLRPSGRAEALEGLSPEDMQKVVWHILPVLRRLQ